MLLEGEAMEWARRFPAPSGETADGEIEVRPLRAATPHTINTARKSLTLVNVGPGTSRSPSGAKKL